MMPMSGYTQQQLAALQSYISGAQNAINTGDVTNALNYVNLYYQSQTTMRGYANDALQVVNNVGTYGAVARP